MTVLAQRLVTARGGGSFRLAPIPSWSVTKYASNPIIDVDNNASETTEQYVPAPVKLPNGDIWVYVKGQLDLYAWKSTDGGETFSLQNGGNKVLSRGGAGTWDAGAVVTPAAVYDEASDTIHLYYGGAASGVTAWGWGHATAPGSDPTTVTKDSGNPIFSNAAAVTALGGTVNDFKICDVVVIRGSYYFYGYAQVGSRYKMVLSTGTDWDNPSGLTVIATAPDDASVIIEPTVFRVPGEGITRLGMFYTRGALQQFPTPLSRTIRFAHSLDGETWDMSDTTDILAPVASTWESGQTYASSLLKESTPPYLSPVEDGSDRLLLYYSGYDGTDANSGLAYLTPS